MNNLENIKGISITTIKNLNALGINTVNDLITYYPFRYEVIEKTDISSLNDCDKVITDGVVENNPNVYYFSKKLNKMTFRINTNNKILTIVIFNRAYLRGKIGPGDTVTIIGKYEAKYKSISASEIRLGKLDKTEIEPIYHSSFKITSKKINKVINSIIDDYEVTDYIPEYLNKKYNLMNKKQAIKIIHNPKDKTSLNKALSKLKYEELFIFMLKINYLKQGTKKDDGLERNVSYSTINTRINALPFDLTVDQTTCIKDIYTDLTSPKRMNRLLQGDVGSGKTIVSFIALYINYLSNYQGALMAPTEILAYQHFQNINSLFPELKVSLLTGKTKAKERREILKDIKDGNVDIIIGTHALISDDVIYNNLGLVITDEQHRFGVNQRANLKNKGKTVDILYMSATPIPRTYALTLYGDMDISSIRTMPNGRKPVKTYLKTTKDITSVLYAMLDEIKKKHQIYVIAPLVEQSDKIDMENVYNLEEDMQKAFGKVCKIGILHGKMKAAEKEEIMNEFKENKIQILISTTVIEVGVDVKNATMIVIFDSYRFGLATLHQLRGRVGRNDLDSYCILISDKETKRLKVLTETNDGFKVSEEDFKLRGSGDLFGQRQSGDMNFKIADIKKDYQLLLKANEDASRYLKENNIDKNIMNLLKSSNNLD